MLRYTGRSSLRLAATEYRECRLLRILRDPSKTITNKMFEETAVSQLIITGLKGKENESGRPSAQEMD
jgi:hypothetical protein